MARAMDWRLVTE